MSEDHISVIDAATELGLKKQTLFKWLKRLSIKTIKQKSSAHRGQAISYISTSDLKLIKDNLEINSFSSFEESASSNNIQSDFGEFYLIQLEPEHDPGRFKLGFASNMPERLRSHRCSAPFARVIKTWACHILWERTAIDSVTQNCEKIHTEVFRTSDINLVVEKCDKFFSLMPEPIEINR